MRIVTINIPDQYLDCLETMVNLGYFPSRSEAVREALKQFLEREQVFNSEMEKERFLELKQKQLEMMINY